MDSNEIFERLLALRQRLTSDKEAPLTDLECAVFWDVALALGLSDDQAGKLAGDPEPKPEPAPEPAPELAPGDYEITDGYIGSWGVSYKTATAETLREAIDAAAQRNGKTQAEIAAALESGKSVEWCDSPNHYYDHGAGRIRRKRAPVPVRLVRCDCGHSVEQILVMNASLGTSCPDCYDRMSD